MSLQEEIIAMQRELDALDARVCREYREALSLAPDLVRRECLWMDFLRTDDMDPKAAALRVARFWKMRRNIFGEDRWLLPLTIAGNGALSPESLEIFHTGYFQMYPSYQLGLVMLCNFSYMPIELNQSQPEIIFYMCTLFSQSIVPLITIDGSPQPGVPAKEIIEALFAALPFRFKQIYIGHAFNPDKKYALEYQEYHHKRVVENSMELSTNCIKGNSIADTLRLAQEKGFDIFCLPAALGGNVRRENFDGFLRSRISLENIMALAPPIRNSSLARTRTMVPAAAAATRDQQPQQQQLALVPPKRVHHEKRQKQTIAALETSIKALQDSNEAIRKQNRRLEGYLAQARLLAAVHYFASGSPQQE